MAKYNRILVAVDGSEASFHALQEAFKISTTWVTVIAVAPSYEGDLRIMGVSGVREKLREPCDTALARGQELAGKAGALIRPVCAVGLPHAGIVREAEAGARDLIVLGAKGQSLIERTLMGNITRRVIGFTSKDVLVIPAEAALGWGRILLATDCSEGSQPAIRRALDLAQAYGGEVVALSVMDLPLKSQEALGITAEVLRRCQDHVAEIRKQGEANNLRVRGVVRKGQAYVAITEAAREEQAGLIVMGSHGHTGLSRLLMGGVTERVIGHAPCPVLVVKRTE